MEFCHFVKVGTHKSGRTIQANWGQCSVTVHPLALKSGAPLPLPKTLHLTHCNTPDILARVLCTAVISFPRTAPHCFIEFHLMNNFFMRSFQCQGWLRSHEKNPRSISYLLQGSAFTKFVLGWPIACKNFS